MMRVTREVFHLLVQDHPWQCQQVPAIFKKVRESRVKAVKIKAVKC